MIPRFSRTIDNRLLTWSKSNYIPIQKNDYFFAKGRYAFYAFLKVLARSKIIVPVYICESVIEAALAAKKTPILMDINKDFQLDYKQLKTIIGKNKNEIAAVVVPHYFGIENKIEPIRKIVGKEILIIEDCAHLPFYLHKIKGDAAIYSFNFDKPVSLGNGGLLRIKNKKIAALFSVSQYKKVNPKEDLRELYGLYIQTWLMQPDNYKNYLGFEEGRKLAGSVLLRLFNYAPWLLRLRTKRTLLAKIINRINISKSDKYGRRILMESFRLSYLAEALAKYKKELKSLKQIEKKYMQKLPKQCLIKAKKAGVFLKFPIFCPGNTGKIIAKAKLAGIELGNFNWPQPVQLNSRLKKYCIILNKLPNSLEIAKDLLQLPLYPNLTENDQQKIIEIIRKYGE